MEEKKESPRSLQKGTLMTPRLWEESFSTLIKLCLTFWDFIRDNVFGGNQAPLWGVFLRLVLVLQKDLLWLTERWRRGPGRLVDMCVSVCDDVSRHLYSYSDYSRLIMADNNHITLSVCIIQVCPAAHDADRVYRVPLPSYHQNISTWVFTTIVHVRSLTLSYRPTEHRT